LLSESTGPRSTLVARAAGAVVARRGDVGLADFLDRRIGRICAG